MYQSQPVPSLSRTLAQPTPLQLPWCNLGWCFLLILTSLSGCQFLHRDPSSNQNLLLGNPSGATASLATPNNYLIERSQYVLSYNREQGIPNWASWQLNRSWLGSLPRADFMPDDTLPAGWYRVTPQDYTGSGFDRGHLVPAADRNQTTRDRSAVFWMTNILPQAPENNRGPWEQLESYCRDLVKQGNELTIIAGGAGIGGQGSRGRRTSLGKVHIAVPAVVWKVVVVSARPGLGIKGISGKTRVIAVIIPNQNRVKGKNWHDFVTSIQAVEALTGYDFLANLPSDIRGTLAAKIDSNP